MTNEKIQSIVRDLIEKHAYLTKKDDHYESDLYVDYQDQLSDDQILKICKADNKMDAFYDELEEFVRDSTWYAEDEVLAIVKDNWDEEEYGGFIQFQDAITDYLREIVYFNFNYNHFLSQDVYVNVLVDTGDSNYDYTLNNFASYNASNDEEIDEESSILWLVRQQGYTKEQLENAAWNGEYGGSKFLKSVHTELVNVSTHMNALAFFVTMTLQEYIDFSDSKQSLILGKDTSCGLYDCWNGAGGCLEIKLEKDVVIPHEYIEAHIDGTRGYSIDEIYGMMNSFWTDTVKGYIPVNGNDNNNAHLSA
jgi:hypothetical protein